MEVCVLFVSLLYLINTTMTNQLKHTEGNAKLIAAAPDLLKALARVENHLRDVSSFRVLTPAELDVLETVIKAYDKATK